MILTRVSPSQAIIIWCGHNSQREKPLFYDLGTSLTIKSLYFMVWARLSPLQASFLWFWHESHRYKLLFYVLTRVSPWQASIFLVWTRVSPLQAFILGVFHKLRSPIRGEGVWEFVTSANIGGGWFYENVTLHIQRGKIRNFPINSCVIQAPIVQNS